MNYQTFAEQHWRLLHGTVRRVLTDDGTQHARCVGVWWRAPQDEDDVTRVCDWRGPDRADDEWQLVEDDALHHAHETEGHCIYCEPCRNNWEDRL